MVGVNAQWKQGNQLQTALITVNKNVSPKAIRQALNKVCGTKEQDWVKQDGALIKGEVINGNINCSYLTNSEARNCDVVIKVN